MGTARLQHASRKTASAGSPAPGEARFKPATDSGHASDEEHTYALASVYLGGAMFWPVSLSSKSDVHSAIMDGVPYASLIFLVGQVKALDLGDVVNVLGISTRTLRRQSDTPSKTMPSSLASKAWLFAEVLAKVTQIIGSKADGERWLCKPAVGLDGQRPIDMLRTVQGTEVVGDFLTRLEYGVYS